MGIYSDSTIDLAENDGELSAIIIQKMLFDAGSVHHIYVNDEANPAIALSLFISASVSEP